MFLKGYKKEEGEEGYATETTCGWQSPKIPTMWPFIEKYADLILRGYVTATTMKEKWIPTDCVGQGFLLHLV